MKHFGDWDSDGVQLVIADTSPINYLILIGHIDILPALFERVILPGVVRNELSHPKAPLAVRNWVASPPSWVTIHEAVSHHIHDPALDNLDAGEEDAILLAVLLHADVVLMDDGDGVIAALKKGLEVTGTLGLLNSAAHRGLLNLTDSFNRIRITNFRYRQELMDQFLAEHV